MTNAPHTTDLKTFTERLRDLRDALLTGLVERDVAIRLALIATLAGEHMLMVGPPGTAKSLIARRLRLAMTDAIYFERLLTRFTVPEELFGPLSIKGLEEDRYERLTEAYLPTASIAFLDEIFKANSAILNALLTLLNERAFDNGTRRVDVPLVAVIGASNELPEGEELAALFDRFLLRLHVGPVSNAGFETLLGLRGEAAPEIAKEMKLRPSDFARVQELAPTVEVPGDVVNMLCDLRDWCTAEEIQVSDRRWRKVVKLLQVSALTNGRMMVSIWDCWLLQHCLWDTPEDREKIYDWYAARVGASKAMDPSRLTRIIVAWEGQLKQDQESRSQQRDEEGRPLYQDEEGQTTLEEEMCVQKRRDGELLYLAPVPSWTEHQHYHQRGNQLHSRRNEGNGFNMVELRQLWVGQNGSQKFDSWSDRATYLADANNRLMHDTQSSPLMEPTRQRAAYIEHTLRQIDEVQAEVERYQAGLLDNLTTMTEQIETHLWVSHDFAAPAGQTLEQTRGQVDALLSRLALVRKGIELLPKETPRTLTLSQDTTP